jgi:hypothetical protein
MRPVHFAIAFGLVSVLGWPAAAQNPPKNAAPATPAKPYKTVAVVPPKPSTEPGLDVLRQQFAEAAQKKDRAALARLVVGEGFFWDRENGNAADKKKSGIDNLSAALGLGGKDSVGWDLLAGYAEDVTAAAPPRHTNALCSPADPAYKAAEFDALLKATQTGPSEWGYPVEAGIDVRATPQATAPAIDKLALAFVRVTPDGNTNAPAYVRVVTPAGKSGYVSIDSILPIGNDQLCFVKDGGVWKIGGYIGGGEPL